MENRRLILLLIACWLAYPVLAQKVTPVEDKMLRDSIGENAKHNRDQAGLLLLIKGQTKDTKEEVEATEQLQYDYRTFLKQTMSTASLSMMNSEMQQETAAQVVNASEALGAYSFAANLNQLYQQQTDPMQKSQALYEQLISHDETLVFTDLTVFAEDQKARQLNVEALQEMSQRRKLQLASAYQQLARQKIKKAEELRMLLTSDHRFSMTEAERLATVSRMQNYLLSSQRLQAKADDLIRQSSKPSFTKSAAINHFQKQQEWKVLAGTPLFQD